MKIQILADGGSRGTNETIGASVCGSVIKTKNSTLCISRRIWDATNNVAEYMALITALERIVILSKSLTTVSVRMDSKLVIEQVQGNYKVKTPHLMPLRDRAQNLIDILACPVNFQWIPREENAEADGLANLAYLYEKGETREWWA